MLAIDIPGGAMYRFAHLVLDFNGTLAEDGALIDGVAARVTVDAADLVSHSIRDTLDLLLHPKRLIATLRN
ncbi:MAG: hypothetical protein ACYC3N_07160 [Halothiobacillus sp.]